MRWMGRALLVCLAVSALAGLKIGWDKLKKSPDFKIASIEVIGNKRVSEEEILYLAKIKPGMGIFDFRMGSVVKAVKSHPVGQRGAGQPGASQPGRDQGLGRAAGGHHRQPGTRIIWTRISMCSRS